MTKKVKTKIYLASFLEPDNFGPGKLIGVANGNKPDNIQKKSGEKVECESVFPMLVPTNDIMNKYADDCVDDPKNAASTFVKSFTKQLDEFSNKVKTAAENSKKMPVEVLPFKDGDTLGSWERERYSNYRPLIATCLVGLGYDVVQH